MTIIEDDRKLVQSLQKGNVAAFDTLFEIYSPKLFGFALKYFQNEADAEELVQEVFVKVWENRHSLKSELSFKSYLFTITLNHIRKFFNKRAVSLRYLKSIQPEENQTENFAFQTNDYETVMHQIDGLISQMPPRKQEIFRKSKIEGKSSKEVARELNISVGTVDNQVSEALHFLSERLKKEDIPVLLFFMLFLS